MYYSELKGGFFSQPVNLGPGINTAGNEVFPFVDTNGRLFFASDGLPGLGGLDIFVVLPGEYGFSNPHNLGPDINTPYDDFGITILYDDSGGYFASNRPGGEGSDDIYAFRTLVPLRFTQIRGTITNDITGEAEEAVSISIFKKNGIPVANLESDERAITPSICLVTKNIQFTSARMMQDEKSIKPSDMKAFGTVNLNIKLAPK